MSKDYSTQLAKMIDKYHELDEAIRSLRTLGIRVIAEQRKRPNMTRNELKFIEYCTKLFTYGESRDTVTISREEYGKLTRRSELLTALEAGGVDNWEGYHPSTQGYYQDLDEDEISVSDYNKTIRAKEVY